MPRWNQGNNPHQTFFLCLGCVALCAATIFAAPYAAAQQEGGGIPVAPPAPAAPAPQATPTPAKKTGGAVLSTTLPQGIFVPELVIGGHAVMRLRATAGGLTPDERAYDLRRRLGPILTLPNLTADDVTVYQPYPRQTASIYVRKRLLITVDRNLAQANNTSIAGLALQWANNLKKSLPQVNVAVRMFDVSTGN